MTIFEQIKQIAHDWEEFPLSLNPSYAQTQKEVIDLIDFYWSSKYRDGNKDSLGFLKPFYNIVINPTEVASKMVDLDTKDVLIIAEEGQSYYPSWLFGKEFKLWAKEHGFGSLLNEIIYNLPEYGSVVLKKSGNGNVNLVPLQNLRNKPDAEKLIDGAIIELHEESPAELESHGWDEYEVAWAISKVDSGQLIEYYEIYDETGTIDDGLTNDNYFIIAKMGENILYQAHLDESPYRELHWDKIPGRWLGRGQVERLFESQIAQNKVEMYKSQSLHWTSKRIWQTRDDTVTKNLMTDVETGDLLRINSEITPVATEERNLAAYTDEQNRWDALADKLGFSYDVIRGERSPAGTPLGSAILQTRMAGGFFDLKREDIGLFLKEILFDWIIPSFEATMRGEHKIMFGEFNEDELTKIRNLILVNKTNKAIWDYILKKKRIPNAMEYNLIKTIVAEQIKKEKDMTIPAGYYGNLRYKIDIIITNEQIDVAAKLSTLQVILQSITANPTILQDPRTKKVFYQLLDLAGVSPIQFETEEPLALEQLTPPQVAQRGGSTARIPRVAVTPVATAEETTL